jgi:hypothetical protein
MADVGRPVTVFKKSEAALRGNATDISLLEEDEERSFHKIIFIQCRVT